MISQRALALMRCPHCSHPELKIGTERLPTLTCPACEVHYPFVDGILDMVPPSEAPEPGSYRTETLANIVAGVYDTAAPLMSLGLWRCSPLRWVDSENRALGRANGGVYVRAPISTGMVLDSVLADYHDVTIFGFDRSFNMLRQAAKRLSGIDHPVQLMRVDYVNLPLRDGVVDSLQSFNGLQAFQRRVETLTEFRRCLVDDGYLSGSALIRGEESFSDAILDRLERSGIYPMPRTAQFLRNDFANAHLDHIHFETHGAVMFYYTVV